MKLPKIGDIASSKVPKIDIKENLKTLIDTMCNIGSMDKYRKVIVSADDGYHLVDVYDLLNISDGMISTIDDSKTISSVLTPTSPLICVDKNKSVLDALNYFTCDLNYICVVDEGGGFVGILSRGDLANSLDPDVIINSFCLGNFLNLCKRVKWIDKDELCSSVINDMIKDKIDSFLIVQNDKPLGIFTTKDALRVLRLELDKNVAIKEYMSSPVEVMQSHSTVKEALEFLNNKSFKRVVLVHGDGRLAGVINQNEIYSLAYSKWVLLMKQHQCELKEKNKTLEEIAFKDLLTNLYNRAEFINVFERCLKEASDTEKSFFVAIADIDFFKKINDTYGHNFGDKILKSVATTIKNNIRDSDIVARWGGEEFAIILHLKDSKDINNIGEKIRAAVENLVVDEVSVTISIGFTQIKAYDTLESTIDRADKALYRAKNSGRNRVEVL